MRKLFFLFLALVATTTLWAHTFEVDGIYYNYLDLYKYLNVEVTYRGHHSNSYYNEYAGEVIIPSTVTFNRTTFSVTSIGNSAFSDCSKLTAITIPNSVTSIGEMAFDFCFSLTSITIPNSVTSIGNEAFSGCHSLTSITIPNSVTSIGDYAFTCCSSLTSMFVEDGNTIYDSRDNCNAIIETATNTLVAGCQNTIIPNSVTSIGEYAFFGCDSLTSITIPNSVTSIGDHAFRSCDSLTSITIPNSVTSIGDEAFWGCTSLTSITIPNSVTSIGDSAFEGCKSLTSVVVAEGNTIYDSRDNCNAIIETATNTLVAGCQNTIIPNSVTSIGNSAFKACTSLTSIVIPDSVTSIGECAFFGCSSLSSVNIGNSVTSIGKSAFRNCSALTSVTCEAETPPTLGSYAFYAVSKSIPVYVPDNAVEAYKSDPYWSEFDIQGESKAPSAVDNIPSAVTNTQKIMREGQFIIVRDGVEYNAVGQEM